MDLYENVQIKTVKVVKSDQNDYKNVKHFPLFNLDNKILFLYNCFLIEVLFIGVLFILFI